MAYPSTRLTADDLLRLPDDHMFHELVDGVLTTMSPPGFAHGVCGGRLHIALGQFVGKRRLGLVVPQDTGFKLKTNPDTVRAPDVAFVSSARIGPGPLPVTYWDGAPDLAVEVLSPGERLKAVDGKVREYLACGTRSVWVVRPITRTVAVHHPGKGPVTFTEGDTLEDPVVLPGFKYSISSLFDGLPVK